MMNRTTGRIEIHASGGMTLTGSATELYGLRALQSALRLEMKGLKLSRRRSALALAKLRTGSVTNSRERQLALLEEQCRKLEAGITRIRHARALADTIEDIEVHEISKETAEG
jgi:hypothetical protein